MSEMPKDTAAPADQVAVRQFPEAQRNQFVAPTGVAGSLMQPNPQPVIFDTAFTQGLNELAKSVNTAVIELGPVGRRFR